MEEEAGGFPQVIGLIILVVGTITLVILIGNETLFAKEAGKYGLCYSSIIESYFSTEETTTKCPVTHYKVYSKSIKETLGYSASETDSKIIKDFFATNNKVNELFVKLMGSCLQTGGGLDSRAFSRALGTSSIVCLECSTVEFDREIQQDFFEGLREYLDKTKIPNSDKTYVNTLTKDDEHKEAWIDFGFANNIVPNQYSYQIKKDEIYGIFFVGIKQGTASALIKKRNIFDRDDTYFVYVAPLDKLNNLCDRKVN